MTCDRFVLTLDAGDAASLPADALAHADGCAFCARLLAEAHDLERELEAGFGADAAPPAIDFTARVMARVEAAPHARFLPADAALEALAALASPALATGMLVAAALLSLAAVAGFDPVRLASLLATLFAPLGRAADAAVAQLPATGPAHTAVLAGLCAGMLPLLLLLVAGAWLLGNLIGERTPRAS